MTAKPKAWDPELYEGRFSFVWNLASDLIQLLAPEAGETIVDLGCGTGHLTQKIADSGASVSGIDGDAAMVAQARINFPKLTFALADARRFTVSEPVDAVFSNAVLHWVREPAAAVERIHAALRPGGRFVAEFGGKGNTGTLLRGVHAETGSDAIPWYFPSLGEYATLLEQHGFRVTHGFEIDRPTPLEGDRGIQEWLGMFGESLLESIPRTERNDAVERIVERLRPELFREGRWWVDYRRLRIRAVKES